MRHTEQAIRQWFSEWIKATKEGDLELARSLIADDAGIAGLVCLGYPFHPPGRPQKLRTTHLETLATPTITGS